MPVDERNQKTETDSTTQKPQDAPNETTGPTSKEKRRRRFFTRKNIFKTLLVAFVVVTVLALAVYRLGYVDRYIEYRVRAKLDQFGIRGEIGSFKTTLSPRTAELRDLKLYDKQTNEQLGKIDRAYFTFTVTDLFALGLSRNVKFDTIELDAAEVWVKFDEQGNSNFRNLRKAPSDPRLTLDFLAAKTKLNGAKIHFDNQQHDISGEARNIAISFEPENANLPEEERRFKFDLKADNSTFVYDGEPVESISIAAKGTGDKNGAEIQEFILRSPIAESRMTGKIDDWQKLTYNFKINSTVDLTEASNVFRTETALRGVGNFNGTVTGEGSKYKVEGEMVSDALAADNIRLKALKVNAKGFGEGASYEANGKAIADLLTFEDYQLNYMQIIGNVYGTGKDFRWLGELQAQAAKAPGGATIAGLIIYDAVAEKRDEQLDVTAKRSTAKSIQIEDARVEGVQVNDVRSKKQGRITNATVASASGEQVKTKDALIKNVTANGIKILNREDGPADVEVEKVGIGGIEALGAKTGSLNIAGVRLGIYQGKIQGSSGDIDVGTIALDKTVDHPEGHVENARLAKPVFLLEPKGRYRASADLSLGGGVLGSINLGQAQAALTVTNDQVEVKNFTASIMDGLATGNAIINTASGPSRVDSTFKDLDVGKLITLFAEQVVPLSGKTDGEVQLSFQGTNVKDTASGKIRARFNTEAGDDTRGRAPLNGEVELNATQGLFEIERASLSSNASQLTATGKFSFASNDSDLNLNLISSDASELQRIASAVGLLDQVEDTIEKNKIEIAGNLDFKGNLRGQLDNPSVTGRASVESFFMQERELGSLSANINVTPETISITDGNLTERDGGGATFAINSPRAGENNISIESKLDRANAGNLVAVLPGFSNDTRAQLATLRSDLSGNANIKGLPDEMNGAANLRFNRGEFIGEPFESIVAKAVFKGTTINLDEVDARFDAGQVKAKGTVDQKTTGKEKTLSFNLEAEGNGIQFDKIEALKQALSDKAKISGVFDLKAKGTGQIKLSDVDFSSLNITFDGEGRDVKINDQDAGQLTLTGRTENNRLNVTFTTSVLDQPQTIAAVVDLSRKTLPITIQSNLSNADLTPLFAALMPPESVTVTGRVSGAFNASGELYAENSEGEQVFGFDNVRGAANFTELTFQVQDIPFSAVTPLIVELNPNEITLNNARFTGPGTNVFLNGAKSIRAKGQNNMTLEGSLNLRLLNTFSPNFFFNGVTDVSMRVAGSHDDPRLTGSANLNGAQFATLISNERLVLSSIKGRAIFNLNQIQIDSLTGNLGGGRVDLSGGVSLAGFSPSRYRFLLRGHDVTVPFPKNFRTTADGEVEINGARRGRDQLVATIISGRLNVARSEYRQDIDIADFINQRVEGTLTEGAGSASLIGPTQLDLYLEGRDALVVNNNIADMLGSISLRVIGPLDSPIISGRISATRGFVKFRDKRYELQRAFLDIPAQRNPDPILNINSETEIKGYTIYVSLTGSLTEPSATVRSDPPLPQADVVSLITTGNLASSDTGLLSLAQPGIATAANLLADRLIAAPARKATDKLFGLTRFEIEPVLSARGAPPTARLTVGQQITKDLSVAYSTNLGADKNQVVSVEYRVSNRLSFVAQYEQGSVTGINTQTNNFSFEIKFRKRF
jgi:translocation and assembly module TamB